MLIAEGIVTKSGLEKYTGKDGKPAESYRFSIENIDFLLDDNVDHATVPPVGKPVRAMLTRVWSAKKERHYWFVLGFQDYPAPPMTLAYPANGHVPAQQLAAAAS